jgi:uncharacterized membrane protein
MNKHAFMHILRQQAGPLGPAAVTEILADFEEHFANGLARGKSELEITTELGDPAEIARQYLEAAAEGAAKPPVWQHQTASSAAPGGSVPAYAPANPDIGNRAAPAASSAQVRKKVDESALVAVLLLNIFLGIPIWLTLFSVLFGFWVAAGSIGVVACVLFAIAIIQAGMTSLILVLFGVSMTALTILGVIFMVYLTKWLVMGLTAYIRWNKRLVYGGAPA